MASMELTLTLSRLALFEYRKMAICQYTVRSRESFGSLVLGLTLLV